MFKYKSKERKKERKKERNKERKKINARTEKFNAGREQERKNGDLLKVDGLKNL